MRKEKVMKNVIVSRKRNRVILLNYLEKVALIKLVLFILPLAAVGLISIVTEYNLTNIARENYANNKGIERVEKEIDSIKSELIAISNVVNIQKESKNLGFVYNQNVKYIK
ncbi:hypothetical protein STFE110948_03540 [Streptobacillus felis]|uniref:Uncharacterized protein n=1 Tax=Streptobacillus felis TaxID=1384509 RepID=A0A7Z0T9V5_9FUSO|nr:hypothetical protein [Streptobacillus felis]NYV27395.1 hypothetical protein [Streptobacillus felis]